MGAVSGKHEHDEQDISSVVNKAFGLFKYRASSGNRYKSIVRSDYLAITPVSPSRDKEYVLLLFGYQYASSPGKLQMIALDQRGYPSVIFDDEFEVSRLEDLDGDNLLELIGEPWYERCSGQTTHFTVMCRHTSIR